MANDNVKGMTMSVVSPVNVSGCFEEFYWPEKCFKRQMNLVDGKFCGGYTAWAKSGIVERQCMYNQDGKLTGKLKDFYHNGALHIEATYYAGRLTGWCSEYNEDRTLKSRSYFIFGVRVFGPGGPGPQPSEKFDSTCIYQRQVLSSVK